MSQASATVNTAASQSSTSESQTRPAPAPSALGLVAVLFYAIHAGVQIAQGRPTNLLWACHVGGLLTSLGVLLRLRDVATIGTLMLTVGFPLWAIDLALGSEFYPTSVLVHVGVLAIGACSLRQFDPPYQQWLKALAVMGTIIVAARLFTTPEDNVNLAFRPWANIPILYASLELHLLVLLGYWAIMLWLSEQVLRWLVTRRRPA